MAKGHGNVAAGEAEGIPSLSPHAPTRSEHLFPSKRRMAGWRLIAAVAHPSPSSLVPLDEQGSLAASECAGGSPPSGQPAAHRARDVSPQIRCFLPHPKSAVGSPP